MKDRLQVWYCAKFDEIHLIQKFVWNKHMRATLIEGLEGTTHEWVTITWPRPNRDYPFVYLGGFL